MHVHRCGKITQYSASVIAIDAFSCGLLSVLDGMAATGTDIAY